MSTASFLRHFAFTAALVAGACSVVNSPDDPQEPGDDDGGSGGAGSGCVSNDDCSALDDECVAGLCDAGQCTSEPLAQGTACGDATNEGCNLADTCDGAGTCEPNPAPDGALCDDDPCFTDQTCMAGQCQGGTPMDCSAMTVGCQMGVCDSANGMCTTQEQTMCVNGDGCCPTACDETNDDDCTPRPTCADILAVDANASDGVYTIDPDGMGTGPAIQVYCDMTTDGGGWTLVLNRIVDSDNTGQPNINNANGSFNDQRSTNWNHDIDLFWSQISEVVFAAKENNDCPGCSITGYDSAIKAPRPAAAQYSPTCTTTSQALQATKLVGPSAGMILTAYMCAASLGWGDCTGQVCHYGTHYQNTSSNGSWSQNNHVEMHFPSQHSSYASYGDVNNPPSAWCRSCAGGLPIILNQSSTCCSDSSQNARSRWTIWVR